MPEPTPPTPEPKRFPWEDFLPSNWRKIVAWIILAGIITLINWIRGKDTTPIPIPDPTDLFFFVPADVEIDPATLAELERRGVKVRFGGWRPPTAEETQATLAMLATPRWGDTEAATGGDGPEDDAPLWRMYSKVAGGPIPPHDQSTIGSCVSFGAALATEISLTAKIHGKRGPPQQFSLTVREAVYGGSRINVDPRNPIRGGDGSTGERAARWGKVGGALPQGNHGPYSVQRAREWGDRGVPANLVPDCKANPYTSTLVTSADAARQAIQQGYAIFVCSNVGFETTRNGPQQRDNEGFLRPGGQWNHCMCIAGYQGGKRKGFLIINSWGERWVAGPTGRFEDIPPGSFWADSSVVDRMLRQNDSFAVAGVEGFKRRKIEPSDWIVTSPKHRLEVFDHAFALAP